MEQYFITQYDKGYNRPIPNDKGAQRGRKLSRDIEEKKPVKLGFVGK